MGGRKATRWPSRKKERPARRPLHGVELGCLSTGMGRRACDPSTFPVPEAEQRRPLDGPVEGVRAALQPAVGQRGHLHAPGAGTRRLADQHRGPLRRQRGRGTVLGVVGSAKFPYGARRGVGPRGDPRLHRVKFVQDVVHPRGHAVPAAREVSRRVEAHVAGQREAPHQRRPRFRYRQRSQKDGQHPTPFGSRGGRFGGQRDRLRGRARPPREPHPGALKAPVSRGVGGAARCGGGVTCREGTLRAAVRHVTRKAEACAGGVAARRVPATRAV